MKLIFILYDGIGNSVFYSQVLTPLLKRLDENKNLSVTIISFERKTPKKRVVNNKIKFIFLRTIPFFGKKSLYFSVFMLYKALKKILLEKDEAEIIIRGPLAGFVVLKFFRFFKKHKINSITIQARGLAAEEFRYAQKNTKTSGLKTLFKKVFKNFLYNSYKKIEHEVYKKQNVNFLPKVYIKTVSPALANYLIKNFDADKDMVSVCYKDIPEIIDQEQIKKWREQVRSELKISEDKYVYCYTGSARPWQMIDQMVQFALKKTKEDKKNFFLFFSQDKKVFEKKLREAGVSSDQYFVQSIHPTQTYKYLSAADAGLLFREKDPVNWVSRPTKMLEYQSVRLKIIHNNNISWLVNSEN